MITNEKYICSECGATETLDTSIFSKITSERWLKLDSKILCPKCKLLIKPKNVNDRVKTIQEIIEPWYADIETRPMTEEEEWNFDRRLALLPVVVFIIFVVIVKYIGIEDEKERENRWSGINNLKAIVMTDASKSELGDCFLYGVRIENFGDGYLYTSSIPFNQMPLKVGDRIVVDPSPNMRNDLGKYVFFVRRDSPR